MAENPFDRTNPTMRDCWDAGFAAGVAAERERIAAGLADLACDLKRDSEGGRGLSGGHIESIALALRATGEVRG